MSSPPYAELHAVSNFSFLRGASHPHELIERAADLGYAALALTDECSLAGAVRAHVAAKDRGVRLIVGTELQLADGPGLVLLAMDREGYGAISHLITLARRRSAKGSYSLSCADLEGGLPGCLALLLPDPGFAGLEEARDGEREYPSHPLSLALSRKGRGEALSPPSKDERDRPLSSLSSDSKEDPPSRLPDEERKGPPSPLSDEERDDSSSPLSDEERDDSSSPLSDEERDDSSSPLSDEERDDSSFPLSLEGRGWGEGDQATPEQGRIARPFSLALSLEERGEERDAATTAGAPGRGPTNPLPPPRGRVGERGETAAHARWLAERFPGRAWIAVELLHEDNARQQLATLTALSRETGLPLAAAGGVHMHVRARKPLQDLLTAIRLKTTVPAAGLALHPNGERHLRRRERLARIYPRALLEETVRIAERCRFSLNELRYEYPQEIVPDGETPAGHLRRLAEDGAGRRYPQGVPEKVRTQIDRELRLIAELAYETFFLTVHDIVRYARGRGILCQGRGSAANSAVCFCLGITEVDPARMELLFERFLSRERHEPPDIDVDFEHERREEVIQYIYEKYGRDRTALAATVIRYRLRSALRDAGRALGMAPDQLDALSRNLQWWDRRDDVAARLRELGFSPDNPLIRRVLALTCELLGFPRHLSQHVGGFVISGGPLSQLVPIENAAMPGRTVIQWDKDDLDALGLLKVDCLALGMLSAIRRALDLVNRFRGCAMTMADIPADDPPTYAMIQQADTIGVFQIESRAQMVMLPRLKPRNFYDLVIEVAIVRPGPIQGDMVHPYLQRRDNPALVDYQSEALRPVLERTLGVPIFQEQVIKLAMVAAGFTPGEADQLRRSMAAWRRDGDLPRFERRLIEGMRERGYSEEFAQRIYRQIQGFGEYGFPESHAASFALLAYVSAWLKRHEPAAFTCALLNSQPMGFYAPSQLVQDARRHGVEVRPVDARHSDRDCTLERRPDGAPALRLGLRMAKDLSQAGAEQLVSARRQAPFCDLDDLKRRTALHRRDIEALAAADALSGLSGNRHQARWQALAAEPALPLFEDVPVIEAQPLLRPPGEGENIVADYGSVGLTLRRHPLALLRPRLDRLRLLPASAIRETAHGTPVRTGGLVINRQRPGTATGVVFMTLEDETGCINVVIWSSLFARRRRVALSARLLVLSGEVQREGSVIHVIARQLHDHTGLLGALPIRSRDFQ